jgi:diguanylate cyclase (GGDEF) domain
MTTNNDALSLISIQHELGMAIGRQLLLRPMLEHFSRTCIRRLGIAELHFYLYLDANNAVQCTNILPDSFVTPFLSTPHRKQLQQPLSLGAYFEKTERDNGSFVTEAQLDYGKVLHYYNLANFGVVVLHRMDKPLADAVLQLLRPIFQRLAISCQASIEHEQLLLAIEARERAEQKIRFQLYHDELTQLPNRRFILKKLEDEIVLCQDYGIRSALLFIDLDRFKSVNDSLGHSTGDALLVAVARILQTLVFDRDVVARLAGDEFVLLISGQGNTDIEETIHCVLGKLRDAFSIPVLANGHMLHITPSVGIDVFPGKCSSADIVLRNADSAMYIAKSQGPNSSAFYNEEMSREIERRLEIEKELQAAIKDFSDFTLHYQPQFCDSGECVGAEALIRWNHSNPAICSPGVFISVAEDTGLMLEIGRWVIRRVCEDIKQLQRHGLPEHFDCIAVNVSALQFNQSGFVDELFGVISRTGVDPALLEIELTESTLVKNMSETVSKMHRLRNLGVRISVDDFGTGYSSLAYLNRFPISTLKIDQSFVRNMDKDVGNRAIVETIIALGNSLGLAVIAEGVESETELNSLKSLGCEYYQGFYFERPQPLERLQRLVTSTAMYLH